MSAEHGFPTTPPNPEAGIAPGSPPLSAESRAVLDAMNQSYAEMTKTHKAALEAVGADIHDKLDSRVKAAEEALKVAATAIKDQDVKYQALQAELENRSGTPDAAEAAEDRQWVDGLDAFVRFGAQMPQKTRAYLAASNAWSVAEQARKPGEEPVAFEFDPVAAVSGGGLHADFGPGAGVWARPTFERNVTKLLIEFSPIRRFARVIPIGSNRYVGVLRNANRDQIQKTQEGNVPTQETEKDRYEERPIVPHERSARPGITRVAIEDSVIPLESEIRNDAVLDFAVFEAEEFTNGSGANEPHGYAVDTAIGGVISRNPSTMDHFDLTRLSMNLRPFYRSSTRAAYGLSTDALLSAMLEEDGMGRRLWQPSNKEGMPSLLNGWRFFEATEQASIVTAAKPAFFANWDLAYRIVDRRGMLIIRDEITKPGLVILNMSRRYGGRTWLTEAIKSLTIA